MTPVLTFFIGLTILVLFGWYFATETDRLRRILGTVLTIVVTAFCLWSTYPPFDEKRPDGTVIRHGKIHLGLDLQGGTSFLIRLEPPASADGGKRPITKAMVDQAIEAIRKRVDRFGVSEPIITPQGNDRILVQIPGLDAANIQEAREQLSRVAKLEFRLVYPDNGQRLKAIDDAKEVIPPEYRIETYTQQVQGGKPIEERLLVKKKADLGGNHVSQAAAGYGQEGWEVTLRFDTEGAKTFGQITEANVNHRFAIVLDGAIQSAPVIRTAIYGGNAVISGGRMDEPEARNLASVLENPLQTPVKIEEERQVSASLGSDSIKSGIYSGIAGFILVVVFMIIYYRLVGLIADIALADQLRHGGWRAGHVQQRPDTSRHCWPYSQLGNRGGRQCSDLRTASG